MHYRLTTYEFNPNQFDEMMAYADGIKDKVAAIDGLNFAHVCRTSESGAVIVAQYTNKEVMENATSMFQEIMGGMAQFFTGPPSPVSSEVIWQTDN